MNRRNPIEVKPMIGFKARWRSQRNATRHAYVGRGGVRRLCVEAMEGRLMLSTNVADFASPDYHATQDHLYATELQAIAIDSVNYVRFTDGGFLKYFTFSLDGAAAGAPILLHDSNVAGDVDFGSVNGTRANLNLQSSIEFDADILPTPGIPILVISPNSSDATPYANSPSPLAADFLEEFSDEEGGEIPIQSIIASIGPGAISTVSDRAIVTAPVSPQDIAPAARILTAAVADRRISGEWARPMMLELAGGEQATHERQSANRAADFGDGHAAGRPGESPLSFHNESRDSAVHLAHYQTSKHGNAGGSAASAAEGAVNDGFRTAYSRTEGVIAHEVKQRNLSSRVDSNSPASGETPAETVRENVISFDDTHSAHAEVFDQLGAEDAAGAPLIDHACTWGTPLKATSLLMILALERIATGNSRRGKAHMAAQAQMPKRPRVRSLQALARK